MSWSDLPAELVAGITDRITEHVDLAHFRSVCPSWRSASVKHDARRRAPLLLLPSQSYSHANRRLWSPADDTIKETPMPAACGRSFTLPLGWTLGMANDLSATLLQPFTGASESLPALPPSFHGEYEKILSDMVWDRSPGTAMISPGKGVFFRKLSGNDGSWSTAGSSQTAVVSSITYDGTFYLLDGRARRVMAGDTATFTVTAIVEPPDLLSPRHAWCTPESTLVVSSGELLVIVKTHILFQVAPYSSGGLFKVFHADSRSLAAGRSEVAGGGIGNHALFVDHCHD